jgi:hypothetical protein
MRTRSAITVVLAGLALAATAPAANASENTFLGTCKLSGVYPSPLSPGGRVVQRGTCEGWLNGGQDPAFQFGNPESTYRVKVTTESNGFSIPRIPVLLDGPGTMRFAGHRVTIPFRLEQLGLALRILGAGTSSGYGHVIPGADGRRFNSRLEFPTALRG